jgi:hypothetical protein
VHPFCFLAQDIAARNAHRLPNVARAGDNGECGRQAGGIDRNPVRLGDDRTLCERQGLLCELARQAPHERIAITPNDETHLVTKDLPGKLTKPDTKAAA